jgi:hypothetical protein
MHGHRAIAFLLGVAFLGAVFTPCRRLISVSVHGSYEASGESGQGASDSVASGAEREESVPSYPLALKALCPCGCDERPAVAGSSPGLGVALVARAPSLYSLPSQRELGSHHFTLPPEPPRSIDIIPRLI